MRWQSIIDTGSFNGVEINEDIARKLSVQDQGRPVEGMILIAVGGTVTSDHANIRTVTLPEIKFCGGKYPQAEADISPGVPRVGSHFLKDYLQDPSRPAESSEANLWASLNLREFF